MRKNLMRHPLALKAAVLTALTASIAGLGGLRLAKAQTTDSASSLVPNALAISVSEKGREYIYRNFNDIILKNGFSLTEGMFPYIGYEASEPFTMEALKKLLAKPSQNGGPAVLDAQAQKTIAAIEKVRSSLSTWLRNFRLNDPKFKVRVLKVSYKANFTRFGVRTDADATRRLGKPGVAFMAELEVPEILVNVYKTQANDLNNPFLGTFGVDNLRVFTTDKNQPLRAQMPFAVTLEQDGSIRAEALPVVSNIEKIPMDLSFDRPLKLPDVRIRINGHEARLDTREIEEEILRQRDGMLRGLQAYLKDFSRNKVSEILNSKLADGYNPNNGEVNTFDPPGGPSGLPPEQKFQFGIRISDFKLNVDGDQALEAHLGAFIKDPLNPATPVVFSDRGREKPDLSLADPAHQDVVLAVNENLLNSALKLSYGRGYFEEIPINAKEKIKMVAAPSLVIDGSKGPDKAIMKLDVDYEAKGFMARTFAVRNPLHMKFNMLLRLVKTEKGMKIVQDSIDTESLWVDPASLRKWGLNKTVIKQIKKMLQATSDDYRKQETLLADEVPLPQALYGIPLKLQSVSTRPGYVKLFLNLGGAR